MAKNLRRLMSEKNVTAKEMSKALHFPYTTLLSWLNAENYPRIDKIEIMADYFGVKKSDLIEEKLSDEQKAGNEALAGIIVRLRRDAVFRQIVENLNTLDAEKLQGVQQMLNAFVK
nr:MAG TPA: Repressor protein CI [Caudoviricetes sp.]